MRQHINISPGPSTSILREHGYPPDKQAEDDADSARQAEVLAAGWAGMILDW